MRNVNCLFQCYDRSDVITEPEWTPVGVYDFCRSRSRTGVEIL